MFNCSTLMMDIRRTDSRVVPDLKLVLSDRAATYWSILF